jgi:acetolactate synthase I/II/III large subunit
MDEDATVLCDVGSLYMWMSRYFFSSRPRHFLTSNGQQTLGVAYPGPSPPASCGPVPESSRCWATAASCFRPGARDGGSAEVRLRASGLDDGFYDMVKIQQEPKYGRHAAVELGSVDVVKYTEAFGAPGLRISAPGEIAGTLRQAFETPSPVLVDVPIDYRDNAKLFDTVQTTAVH